MLFASCDPSRFLLESKHNAVLCRIYSPISTVEHNTTQFVVSDGGSVDMCVPQLTQYHIAMNVSLLEGEGMVIMMRPIAQETVVDSGLALHLGKTHSYLDSAGRMIKDMPEVRLREKKNEIITLLSENNELEVTIGCDTILKRHTALKESDDVVIAAYPSSKVRIVSPSWKEIPKDEWKDD